MTDVAKRLRGEKAVVIALVEHLHQRGWRAVKVDDGDDEPAIQVDFKDCLTGEQVVENAFSVDVATVHFENAAGRSHWVLLVFGNSPEEVICDYSFSALDDFNTAMENFNPEEHVPCE